MHTTRLVKLLIGATSAASLLIVLLVILLCFRRTRARKMQHQYDMEQSTELDNKEQQGGDDSTVLMPIVTEDLVRFLGGQDLTVSDILDAPGEVIGKSNYGTLYKALLQRTNSVRLLRFLRPVCTSRLKDFNAAIHLLGCLRHPNLVPLLGFYAGSRGEKLLVHPFFRRGNLAHFIRGTEICVILCSDGNAECHKWTTIYRLSIGIAKGLDHLHTGLQKPVIHGNLKSKNILLDRNCEPCISDFGLHLLLNPTAGQEMLETSAAEGYKAPELIKMKDASEETDIYGLGIVLLELLSGKEPVNPNPTPDEDFYLPTFMRNAVLDRRITDIYHPDILINSENDKRENAVTEEGIFRFFQLAMSCCSPSPSLRPNIKQVLSKLEEMER
ncbi:Probable leucine-rich repeat receptor-like protein kinase IMK3 [Linum perenne]